MMLTLFLALQAHNVRLRGVVINQVLPDKMDMVREYFTKALRRWNVPVLGVVPMKHELVAPSIRDLQKLLSANLVSGVSCGRCWSCSLWLFIR
jgi:BioD-like phosphotransacetylase family protein